MDHSVPEHLDSECRFSVDGGRTDQWDMDLLHSWDCYPNCRRDLPEKLYPRLTPGNRAVNENRPRTTADDELIEPYIYFLDEFNPTVVLIWFAAHFVLVVKHLRGESSWILLFLATFALNTVFAITALSGIAHIWINSGIALFTLIAGGIYLKKFIEGVRREIYL